MHSQGRLREEYRKETDDFYLRRARIGSVWAMLFYPLFGLLDWSIYPQYLLPFLMFRGIVEAVLMACLIATYTQFGRKNAQLIGIIGYVALCFSIVGMIHMAEGYESPYYAGIILSLVFLQYITPLSFRSTLIITCLILVSYLLPTFLFRKVTNWPIFINNTTFLTGVIFFLNVSSYYFNQMRFQEFYARFGLAQANEELKKLDVLKSQFFANVSHEVRTPLTSIISPVESLFHGDMGRLATGQQRLIAQVYRNSLKLLDMINQMLDFSKFEARKMQLRLARMDMDEVVREIVATFSDVTERKGIKLRYIKEGEFPLVYVDADKVERILTNLLRNAIKFTDSGSITVRLSRAARLIVLEVEDTGIGIPKEHIPHIFKRFQQVDGSSTRRYEGTGLGLTIVKEAVDLMKGSVSVQSEEGKGSRFRIEIPTNLEELAPDAFIERRIDERRRLLLKFLGEERRKIKRRKDDLAKVTADDLALIERELYSAEEPETEEEEEKEVSSSEPCDHVLLVEDNTDLRNYIGKMLRRFGHEVRLAADGLDGWHQAHNEPPDVIVTDIMMPRMDGYELVSRVKSHDRTKQVPVILITAKYELESKIQGLKTGADDYLPKPVNIRELDARIRNLVSSRQLHLTLARTEELKTRMEELSMSFSQSLEVRDFKTAGHSRDVLELGAMMAQELGLEMDGVLKDSLLLHDIGKLGIPDSILLKESTLSEDEWQIMRKHPELGAELLGRFASYKEVSAVVMAHQEHFDGSGYPAGLKGKAIPLYARIIAIADAYHAMTSDRPYRRALSPSTAVQELITNSGHQFDPKLVQHFVEGLRKRNVIDLKDTQRGKTKLA